MKVLCIGLATVDIQYLVADLPKRNKKVKTNAPLIAIGGPATNAALVASRLGSEVELLSCFGENGFTEMFWKEMKDYNVHAYDLMRGNPFDPIIASIFTYQDNGDRSIISSLPSANSETLPLDNLTRQVYDAILLDGFYIKSILPLVEQLAKKTIPLVLDGGSWKEGMENLLPFINIAVCSEDFFPPGCSNSQQVCDYLFEYDSIEHVVITRGEKSVLYFTKEQRVEIDVKNTDVVDTLGAGDFFHGAFLHYITHYPIVKAIEKSSDIATLSCGSFGTREWFKEIEKIDTL